ncbi:ATP-binding protein [uncultured Paraglaciecola sp.]|uniref:sensor histidine kinase n=1 Tax=uncultured Paraglaciecola sp. TaxID=1765024 RepID=UPI0030D913C7|tara:strand:+ start:73741 stop:74433 length:693 start_codon:yes stop_codon:yes gene_type:complete
MNNNGQIDFATVLASAVHDMKNSLCLLIQSIEDLGRTLKDQDSEVGEHFASAHYEAARLNTGLVQLLSLYRAGMNNMPLNIDEHYVEDVVDEILAANESYINHKKITLNVEQEPDLMGYFDSDLVVLLLNDMLINSMRYSNKHILLRVFHNDQYLIFEVQDDGPGYPQSMLEANTATMHDYDLSQGRTGLGLFFARLIAQAHKAHDSVGSISLANGGNLGGSVFTLKIPV